MSKPVVCENLLLPGNVLPSHTPPLSRGTETHPRHYTQCVERRLTSVSSSPGPDGAPAPRDAPMERFLRHVRLAEFLLGEERVQAVMTAGRRRGRAFAAPSRRPLLEAGLCEVCADQMMKRQRLRGCKVCKGVGRLLVRSEGGAYARILRQRPRRRAVPDVRSAGQNLNVDMAVRPRRQYFRGPPPRLSPFRLILNCVVSAPFVYRRDPLRPGIRHVLTHFRSSAIRLDRLRAIGLRASAAAGDWPQFRGPNATGLAEASSTLPTTFSVDENLKWQVKLGRRRRLPVDRGQPTIHFRDCTKSPTK